MRRLETAKERSTIRVLGLLWCGLFFLQAFGAPAATLVVSNISDTGTGSLRQAILNANATNGPITISFRIPGAGAHTISPRTPLPPIAVPLMIDGTTQPGYYSQPVIELNGAGAGQGAIGLHIFSSNSTIQGLVINRFNGTGIQIEGPGGNVIRGNFIGTDLTGSKSLPNGQQGIVIYSSPGNVIGGTNSADRNLISGNGDAGVYLYGTGGATVLGNFIGTAANGTSRLGNANTGITIFNCANNLIGGTNQGARNVISANWNSGIYLNGAGSAGNLIQGNYLGLNAGGEAMLGNTGDGITLFEAPGNVIGGTNASTGNIISGNAEAGISFAGASATNNLVQGNRVGTDAMGKLALGNSYAGISAGSGTSLNTIGGSGPGSGNLISGNSQDGILLLTSAWNVVQGNWIGVDVTGQAPLANGFNGINLTAANSNLLGGTITGSGNLISGNGGNGVYMFAGATANLAQGNSVGTDSSGLVAVSNQLCGVRLESPANAIGGGTNGAGNLISGNGQVGVALIGMAAASNVVSGNLIGTDITGTGGLGNNYAGIEIFGAPRNTIGGALSGEGNVISANFYGVDLITNGASGNAILGNTIGADITGSAALGNWDGIYIENASSNMIGGVVAGAGNLISGNLNYGVWINHSSGILIQGNLIGTQSDGISPLGNYAHGVECTNGANNNIIGGEGSAANTIAYSHGVCCPGGTGIPAYAGVRIRNGCSNNAILDNSIFGNGALGITLGLLWSISEPNDPCQTDSAGKANLAQNYPVLTEAVTGNGTGIRGTLNSKPNSSYLLQFFANPACESSGIGQGQTFLGQISIETGLNCSTNFAACFPISVPSGSGITSTATDGASNTSEFSACLAALPLASPTLGEVTPGAAYALSNSNVVTLSWTNTGTYVLEQATDLTPPVLWAPSSPPSPTLTSNNLWLVTLTNSTAKTFYRLSFQ